MTLSDIIEDLHAIELRLLDFEKKYGLHSAEFYQLYQQGLLDDSDLEATVDFTRWAGLYEIQRIREDMFRKMSSEFIETLRAQSPQTSIHLVPNPALAA